MWRRKTGGATVLPLIGPPGSGAPVSDNGLFASPVPGLSPNGIGFSPDGHTLYLTNTYTDTVLDCNVNPWWGTVGSPRVLARVPNDDLEKYPAGFDALVLPDTHFGASTPINGSDGLRVDRNGGLYAASILGDNVTVLAPRGLLNAPTSVAFVGDDRLLVTNLSIFTTLAGDTST